MCIIFFTIEYILRCWSAPDRLVFIRGLMNLIDLAAILPYYITLIFQMSIDDDGIGLCPPDPLQPVVAQTGDNNITQGDSITQSHGVYRMKGIYVLHG